MWKNLRKLYQTNKVKIKASTWNDEFELPGGSYPVPDYIKIILSIP